MNIECTPFEKRERQECIIRAKVSESSSMSFSCGVTKTNDDALPDGTSADGGDTLQQLFRSDSFKSSRLCCAPFYTIALTYFHDSSVIDL